MGIITNIGNMFTIAHAFNQHNKQNDNYNIYFNFDNIVSLANISNNIYKNNPMLRSKMVSQAKSYDYPKDSTNMILESILTKSNENKNNVFIITNSNIKFDLDKYSKVKIINMNNIENHFKNDLHNLIVDTDTKIATKLSSNKNNNLDMLLYKAV